MTNYVACMFIGHGTFLTERNREGIAELVPIETSPLELNICTFAPPGEGCFYPPDALISLKDTLINFSSQIEDENFERTFQQTLTMAQAESVLGRLYYDPEWAPYFNKRYQFSGLCKKTYRYFEKKFSSDEEINSGVYIIKNNIGLPNNSILSFDNPQFQTLKNITNYFNNLHLHVEKLFILDATCSVFLNLEKNGYINDRRTISRLGNDLVKISQLAGRKKRRHSKKKTLKNKTKKLKFKKIRNYKN